MLECAIKDKLIYFLYNFQLFAIFKPEIFRPCSIKNKIETILVKLVTTF